MIAWFRHALPYDVRFLDRMLIWVAALLVLAVISFAGYYYMDQRSQQSDEVDVAAQHELSTYEQAVRDNPEDPVARGGLAQLYYSAGRYEEAAAQYEAVLTIDETSLPALYGLGRAQLANEDSAAAMESFGQIITLTEGLDILGDYVEGAHYYLGTIALDQQRPADAVAEFREAVAIDVGDADAWYMLGTAHLANGEFDESIGALTRAVLFVPNFTEAYETLAAAYEAKGMDGESRYGRGMAAYSRGKHGEALKELEAATEASPNFAAAYAGLGLTREARSERDLAIGAYRRALELDPNDFTAQTGLARLGAVAETNTDDETRTTP